MVRCALPIICIGSCETYTRISSFFTILSVSVLMSDILSSFPLMPINVLMYHVLSPFPSVSISVLVNDIIAE